MARYGSDYGMGRGGWSGGYDTDYGFGGDRGYFGGGREPGWNRGRDWSTRGGFEDRDRDMNRGFGNRDWNRNRGLGNRDWEENRGGWWGQGGTGYGREFGGYGSGRNLGGWNRYGSDFYPGERGTRFGAGREDWDRGYDRDFGDRVREGWHDLRRGVRDMFRR